VAFLRQAGRAIRRVRVRHSDPSGVAVEERIWFNDSTDAAGLAEEVADHLARGASGRPDLQASPRPRTARIRSIPHRKQ